MNRLGCAAAIGTLAVLCGCKPDKPHAGRDPALAAHAHALAAAEAAIRADLPAARTARFRGEQVYDQAIPDRRAVCGQVSPYPDDEVLFVPFVAVMTRGADGKWTSTPDTRFIGTTVADADRTYLALVSHCYSKGGPADGPLQSVAPLPPVPNQIPRPAIASATPAPATPAPVTPAPGTMAADAAPGSTTGNATGTIPAGGTVTLRQNANLHASPRGAPVRVVPQGTALHVLATAPGGWYQVGEDAPWGWVHESMLDKADGAGR